jgi:hypothetical protein
MDFNVLKEIISQFGITGSIASVIIILLWSIGKTEWFTKFMDKLLDTLFTKQKKGKNLVEKDILNHDIFNYVDYWIVNRISAFEFSTDYRTIVFRRYLVIFLESYKNLIKQYVNSKEFENMAESELWNSIFELFNSIILDYERNMEKSGIPLIVIEKMKVKNNDMFLLIIDLAQGICNSPFYNSEKNLLKVYSILNILLSVLDGTLSNVDEVCNSINGQLKGMKFSFGGKDYVEP